MDEAHDHHRVTPEGKEMGAAMARLADAECKRLEAEDEADARCKSCAFRLGTVPNGCIQTQSDALKAVTDDVPFMCHSDVKHGRFTVICHGWFAVRRIADRYEARTGKVLPKSPWEFSPPDEPAGT